MAERSKEWINQALRDLKAAEDIREDGYFEWSCFIAQQAAEKGVKGLLQAFNAVAWGHSVFDLLRSLTSRVKVEEGILNCGRILDRYYIPTRYPNSFESGSPYQYFSKEDAEDAILCSRRILEFCQGILAGTGKVDSGNQPQSQ